MSSYVLVVGFHHKKGTSVEYVYPELETGLDLPPAWNFIPPIALPDGAHNFGKDYIFFTVPSLELKPTTLFGVACYRQVDARKFSNQTPDLTRNTVQKSVVFLSPTALFGTVSHLLDDVTDAFISASSCEEGYEILRNGFEEIQSAVNKIVRIPSFEESSSPAKPPSIACPLGSSLSSVSFQVRVSYCEAAFASNNKGNVYWMMNGGLSSCALIDDTWVGERACWPLATLSQSNFLIGGSANASADVPIVQENNADFTNRHQSTIRICPPSTEPGARLRDLPLPLNRAIQLSRFDRVFIDHLVNTAELWFSAKAAKEVDTGVQPPAPAMSEEITPRQLAEAEVLTKFPGGQMNDFNFNFVSCFRTTHNFLAWRSQYVLPSVMQQIAEEEEEQKGLEATPAATEVMNGKTPSQPVEPRNADGHDDRMKMTNPTSPQPTRDIYAVGCPLIHPGRNFPSSEPTDQIVNNLKQFGNIAVDHGRRMLSGLMKLGNEKNASGGASILRRFASNVRSALDSVQSPITSSEKPAQPYEK
ncbi:unnamed protein product [Rodentolepis nana]|uniref:Avl9 domain-containing protein n=1 Tax=Rodentolepis nana TaxID=102285 RepID=A0A0R3TU93_RODNA|nr:unnamed protein product [Rodentolepis nana]